MLGVVGTAVGLAAWVVAAGPISALIPSGRNRAGTLEIDARIGSLTALLMVATTVFFGLLPAFRGTRVHPGDVLRAAGGRMIGSGATHRTQRTLVAAEVALAMMLLISGGGVDASWTRGTVPP